MAYAEPGVIAYYALPVLTAALAFAAGRANKGFDARVAAEAALIGTGPTIIAAQNERMRLMGEQIDELWRQLSEISKREQECQDQLREQRHQIRDQDQKIIALEHKLGISRE